MRLGVVGLVVSAVVACVLAVPSSATHERIILSIDGTNRLELPHVDGRDNDVIRFSWGPPPMEFFEGDNLWVCWNGRFDRSQLTSDRPSSEICSSGSPGSLTGSVDPSTKTKGTFNPTAAGHYEAFIKRLTACQDNCYPPPPPHWNASNVVAYDVVDPCRLRLDGLRGKAPEYLPLVIGQPVTCTIGVEGDLRVSGEDGSKITLASARLSSIHYDDFELPWAPMFKIGSRGANSDVSFSLKSRLSQFPIAHTGAAMVIAVSPASVKIVQRRNVSRIRVLSGRVVAFAMGSDFIARSDLVPYCGRKRPTIACLSKIRYRYFTMKRGTSLRARALRTGMKATFRKPRSVVTILRP
jgi:hypothetical protein